MKPNNTFHHIEYRKSITATPSNMRQNRVVEVFWIFCDVHLDMSRYDLYAKICAIEFSDYFVAALHFWKIDLKYLR